MIKKILIGTDFSVLSAEAETVALHLAKTVGAECRIFHVIEAIDGDGDETVARFYTELKEKAAPQVEERVLRFRAEGLGCEGDIVIGKRWQEIVQRAADECVDLIVLGSRPAVQDGKTNLGTTSQHVFFASTCSLLAVRPQA